MKRFKVGVVQSTPVFFDLVATLEKTETIVAEQAAQGVQLLLFPESYLPGYPRGFDFGAVVGRRTIEGRKTWQAYWDNSVAVGDQHCDRLAAMARKYQLFIVMGVTERDEQTSTLYCSLLYFSPTEGLLGCHRKLKPTGSERLIWGEGGPNDLEVYPTVLGKIGGLICWENLMPLARMALYQQGIQVYLAPTADARATWLPILQHIAQESRCFVLGANQYFRKSDYPEQWRTLAQVEEDCCRGGSVIVSPLGEVVAGPLWDQEGVLTAFVDLDEVMQSRYDFSAAGHYQRPDIFEFKIRKASNLG
ncbi:carbon-nitrogen hydrolase family protein [Lewinella sp. LCG006]|uniref:carbon-nitrogen hydrolase family protein n=1 Tax=Lewinella sp. LCG006 TaxID=3231911 RepID=UPI003460E59F